MTVRVEEGFIFLEGRCAVEEAETVLEALLANPGTPVDWSGCTYLHTAVLQVLLAARPPIHGVPQDEFLRRWMEPLLT